VNASVDVRNLSKSFARHEVLSDVSLRIEPGQVAALLGLSGAGKSTLLRCIADLERPDNGDIVIRLNERDAAVADAAPIGTTRRAVVGMVFQQFELYPHMRAIDNVALALRHVQHLPRPKARDIATEHLQRVGLGDFLDRYPLQLSGGQQQRVAIARSLALSPDVMLFDEPTSSLDPEMTAGVLGVMRKLAEDGMTMIVATHEMEFARDVADIVFFMEGGTIVEATAAPVFFSSPSTDRAKSFLRRILKGSAP